MMIALLDGSARSSTELGRLSGVAITTASTHLNKLCEGRLLSVKKQGRHRYYRLANEEVAHLVEALSQVREPRRRLPRKQTNDSAVLSARTCYGHLAGRLGVRLFARLSGMKGLRISDDSICLTATGVNFLVDNCLISDAHYFENLVGGACIDSTERHFHLSGPLGKSLLQRLMDVGWVRTNRENHALQISPIGLKGFAELGIDLSDVL